MSIKKIIHDSEIFQIFYDSEEKINKITFRSVKHLDVETYDGSNASVTVDVPEKFMDILLLNKTANDDDKKELLNLIDQLSDTSYYGDDQSKLIEDIKNTILKYYSDAKRLQWMLNGNGYFLEEEGLCGIDVCNDDDEMNQARKAIDNAMKE